MRISFNHPKLRFYIGDVREISSLQQAVKGVNYVFHAAALKQVPSCEFYPMEAIRTNIIGTENVLSVSTIEGVEQVVVLSTDKAVYPINAMGMTKAMAEKIMIAKSRLQKTDGTVFCATRYGNVMASRGSVIPLFVKQIQESKSLTLTDPNMTRFLMTLEDSVDLVLHAFTHAQQGDIFVQKAPASTLEDLVLALKELFNKLDHQIEIIGTRHGEKLYETLISREEMTRAIDMGEYYRIPADNRNLNYEKYFSEGEAKTSKLDDYTSHNANRLNVEEIKNLILTLDIIKGKINA
tara:strand:+ start:253 stop:1134 length:882 start_codon:yes stop_codon:yes gene_type:complete